MMNFIASCLLAATVNVEPAESIQLMSAEAPKAYRLGAGDGLGRAVFDNYRSMVRARQQEREHVAKAVHYSKWSVGVRLGDRVVRFDCADGEHRVIYERVAVNGERRSTL